MLQKLPKFLVVAQKTASCPKVAEQLVDRATHNSAKCLKIITLGTIEAQVPRVESCENATHNRENATMFY